MQNASQLLLNAKDINVSNYVFDPCMVLLASKAPLLVFCLWPSGAITHSGPSSHSSSPSARPFSQQFPGSDRMNLCGSLSADLLVDS